MEILVEQNKNPQPSSNLFLWVKTFTPKNSPPHRILLTESCLGLFKGFFLHEFHGDKNRGRIRKKKQSPYIKPKANWIQIFPSRDENNTYVKPTFSHFLHSKQNASCMTSFFPASFMTSVTLCPTGSFFLAEMKMDMKRYSL